MALKKLQFRPGINKEVTPYTAEGGWIDADKVRFSRGFPEKIGGWQRMLSTAFLGTCRDLTEWATLGGIRLYGIGTNLKYYLSRGSDLIDITPLREVTAAGGATFSATNGSAVVTVTDNAHGALLGDYVTYSGAVGLGGNVTAGVLNAQHVVTGVLSTNTYTITLGVTAAAGDSGSGGGAVVAAYQLNVGVAALTPLVGWGASTWGSGAWGQGFAGTLTRRFWSHASYGEDLVYGPQGGPLYYFDVSGGLTSANRGVVIAGSDAPIKHSLLLVSDTSRFVIVFGCNELGQTDLDPMLVRWSDQEDYSMWTPSITNQAGGLRLSAGSRIVGARQARQEILIWTDTALYSMQYQGPPAVWGFQLLGENISTASRACMTVVNNTAFWMGEGKFYKYDGRVQTLNCDLLRHVFTTLNAEQRELVFCSTNEGFSEVWWFYPTDGSTEPNRYVVYNYDENIWYNGTMTRTAWLDSRLRGNPIAASGNYLLDHETGLDDADGTVSPLIAHIDSAPVDIDDGDRFAFVWRVLPDVTFERSTSASPSVQMTLLPFKSSGQGYNDPLSVGGESSQAVVRSATFPVEHFTHQVNIRVRGRQIALRLESTGLGVAWQLGSPQVDMKPDGRRG